MRLGHGTCIYAWIRNGTMTLFCVLNNIVAGSGAPQPDKSLCTVIYRPLCTTFYSNVQAKRYGLIGPFNDRADALAQQATHTLQPRPCVLRRLREPLAPSGYRNVRPKRSADVVQIGTPVQSPDLVIQQAQLMHPSDGRERDKQTATRVLPYKFCITHAINHEDQAHGRRSHVALQ